MTHEEWIKLNPEQQRVKVAELCGWRRCNTTLPAVWQHNRIMYQMDEGLWETGYEDGAGDWLMRDTTIPDYLNDLNAMHESEKLLPSDIHKHNYASELMLLTCTSKGGFTFYTATAAQRAEAFVMTLSKE